LRVYFILLDCVNDGEKLIAEAGPNPVEKILSLGPAESAKTLERWDSIIVRQGQRLSSLQGAIFGQNHLAVINPDLQKRISEVVGYKTDRLVTLHGIGAALFFRRMFNTTASEFLAWRTHLAVALGRTIEAVDHDLAWSIYFTDPDENPFEITSYDYMSLASVIRKPSA